MTRFIFTFSLIFGLFLSSTSWASFEEGKDAYKAENWLKAIVFLRPLAESGDDRAQLLLANMYNDGSGVEQNPKTALELYKKSAAHKNHNALLALGTMYSNGIGTEKDFSIALPYFIQSAELGNQASQYFLGMLYMNGDPKHAPDLKVDFVKAYKWFRLASGQNVFPRLKKPSTEISKLLAENKLSAEEIAFVEAFIATTDNTKDTAP